MSTFGLKVSLINVDICLTRNFNERLGLKVSLINVDICLYKKFVLMKG